MFGLLPLVASLLRFRARASVALLCAWATLLFANLASAEVGVQAKTRVWDFESASALNVCSNSSASAGQHREIRSCRSELAHSKAMTEYAAIGTCPVCSQGRLIISRDDESGVLYVLCEECESEWARPEESQNLDAATQAKHGRSTLLERGDLDKHPWKTFLW